MQEKVELWIVNEEGGWVVSKEESDALLKLGEDIVMMLRPVITEVSVTAPDEAGQQVELAVAE